MLRVLVFIAFIFLVSAGLAWLADRPGDIALHWQGYEIRASLMVAALAIAAIFVVLAILWTVIRAILRAPGSFETYLGRRRRDRGYRALSDGMIAVGAGDVRSARKAAQESRTLLGAEPMPLLLTAQAAQLAGNGDEARTAFEALAAEPETRLLGLHGLFIEARRQDEHQAARHFAEQVAEAAPKIGWAGAALFEYQSRDGDWLGAMRTLEANVRAGVIDKPAAQHKRAALLTARAMELEAGEPMEARAAALEAHRLDPSLVPAAVVGSRLLSRASDYRRAARVLEATWKAEPHPDIADAYATVRPGDSVRDRLKRMRRLVELRANHPEGAKAIARAAIDALDWTAARDALDGQVKAGPSEAVCLLMAEIEEREHGDEGKVRMWLARAINAPRDPVWMADGQILDHWMPVSPVSGEVGIVAWKVSPEVPPSRVALQIEADLAIERQTSIDAVETPRIEAKPVAVPEPAPVEDVEPVEPAEVVAAPPEAPEPEVEVEPEPEPAVATVEATPEEVAPSRGGDGAKPQESAARTEPEPEPASEPGPEPSPDETVSETAEAKEEVDGEPVEEEPVVPPSPDDPGPMPDGDDLEAPKRRFRLF